MNEAKTGSDRAGLFLLSSFLIYKTYIVTILPFSNNIRAMSPLLDLIILVSFILITLDFNKLLYIKFNIFKKRNIFLTLTFSGYLFTSFFVNISYNINLLGLSKSLLYIFYFIVFFFIIPRIFKDNLYLFELFVRFIVWFSLFSSIFSILSYYFHFNETGRSYISGVGFFISPNTTAFLYTLSLPVLYYLFFLRKINLTTFIFSFSLVLFALLLTLSRAGYLAFLLSTIIYTYSRSKKLFYFILFILVVVLSTFYTDLMFTKSDSSLARGILILTAVNMIFASQGTFLFGYGVYRATELFFDEKNLYGNFEVGVNNPHNFILLLLLQFGLITALPYLLFIINIIITGFKKKALSTLKERRDIIELLLALILGLLLQNMFEEIIVVPEFPLFAISLIFLGLINSLTRDNRIKIIND